jgi:hypothetical protein
MAVLTGLMTFALTAFIAQSGVEQIPSPAAPGSAEPNLTVAPDGRVYMSWLEPADSAHALRFAVLNDTSWSAPQTIRKAHDFFVNWADFPSIQVFDARRLAAHWLQRTGTNTYAYGVRIAMSSDGGKTWSTPLTPHRDTSNTEHGFVALWREQTGFGAVWLDGRKFGADGHNASNEMMLLTTSVNPNGSLAPETILDSRVCDCCQNAAAVTARGPIVAYRNRSSEEIRDIYVTRRVGGKWTRGVAVYDDNWKMPACPVNGPAISASGNRVAVAWFTAAKDEPRVKIAFSNNAGTDFGKPVRVDSGNPAGRVDVALLKDGSALVSWIERTGGDTAAVQVRRVRANGRTGATRTIAISSAARASGFPRMAVTGSHIVFAWTVVGKPSAVRVARLPVSGLR